MNKVSVITRSVMGMPIWLVDGMAVAAESHIDSVVSRFFDMQQFKAAVSHIVDSFSTEQINALDQDAIEEFSYLDNLATTQVTEIKLIANNLGRMVSPEVGAAVLNAAKAACEDGFEDVVFGKQDAYDYAFKLGHVRIRQRHNGLSIECTMNGLSKNKSEIEDMIFSMNPTGEVQVDIDLITFRGNRKTYSSQSFSNIEEFNDGLLSRASIRKAVKYAKSYFRQCSH